MAPKRRGDLSPRDTGPRDADADADAGAKADAEIDRLRAEIVSLKEASDFYASYAPPWDLVGFKLADIREGDMTLTDLGLLTAAFNERFHYCLLVQPYMDKDLHGQYRLLAVYRYTEVGAWDKDSKRKIARNDEFAMRHFIAGFASAVGAAKRLRPR